jgi:hypothetical protein
MFVNLSYRVQQYDTTGREMVMLKVHCVGVHLIGNISASTLVEK